MVSFSKRYDPSEAPPAEYQPLFQRFVEQGGAR